MGTPSKMRRMGREAFEGGKGRTEGPGRFNWSNHSSDVDPDWLEGWDAANAECDARIKSAQVERDKYRYMPASYKAMDKLTEAVGEAQAELIKDLIEAMICEAANPEQD